ncbi:MAG: chemotaxis-specific protein-glutamate methyltransferase CheB [Myxococcales bacterium]|nr:chemotaxis-specific protein-glutamate methyltransferase CheB [Myxococcales bacterium]
MSEGERTLRVLVVDDSAYNRRTISELLAKDPGVEVVGKAQDGNEALRLVSELEPDLITLDLEMPRMDGFTFLRLLMARRPTPVIVVSGYSAKENVFRALELGALDFVAKPTRTVTSDLERIGAELSEKVAMVRQLAPAALATSQRRPKRASGAFALDEPSSEPLELPPRHIIVIGASTGGPTALVEVFRKLPNAAPAAVVVAQHMPERFTQTFAERLDRLGRFRVSEAKDGQPLVAGGALICPGGRCAEVRKVRRGWEIAIKTPRPSDRYIPSVDRLFESAAVAAAERVTAVVLTGMGSDGAQGVQAIKAEGGRIIAESPDTAVIYGMPGAAVRTGSVDEILALPLIGERLALLMQ